MLTTKTVVIQKLRVRTRQKDEATQKILLAELSLQFQLGGVFGVYGPNGSGKTTFLQTLSGVHRRHQVSGEVRIGSVLIYPQMRAEEKVKKIIYLGSDFHAPFDLTGRDLLALGEQVVQSGLGKVAEVIESLGLAPFLSRVFNTLSDGEQQFMMFARCLVQNPEVLVLDETFSKLDLNHLLIVARELQLFSKKGMTFVIAAHDLNFLSEVSDQMLFLKGGRMVAQGSPVEVIIQENIEALFPELRFQIVQSGESGESGKPKLIY